MKTYVLGLLTLPATWVALVIISILIRAIRDTFRWTRGGLKRGYSRWRWAYLVPCVLWYRFKEQVWSWWHGIETEVM